MKSGGKPRQKGRSTAAIGFDLGAKQPWAIVSVLGIDSDRNQRVHKSLEKMAALIGQFPPNRGAF
ncbi:MAG: hypothetical protein D6680_18470 [Cyanobacteria bacterium J007]|nr:MAG: hypothetical protein D6680_18470 [Cyanobacteria bacterium J007]